jgi:hypothetical protein
MQDAEPAVSSLLRISGAALPAAGVHARGAPPSGLSPRAAQAAAGPESMTNDEAREKEGHRCTEPDRQQLGAEGSTPPVPASMPDQADTADAAPMSPEEIGMLPFHVESRTVRSTRAAPPFQVDEAGRPVALLPMSRAGVPKGAAPWIAGALYWISSQPELQLLTGLSVTPAVSADKSSIGHTCPAIFIRQPMTTTDPDGHVIASMVRQVLKDCGSGLKLIGWHAVRKHLSGHPSKGVAKWWNNPHRGGHIMGGHSQLFYEELPFLFQMHAEKLEERMPGQLQKSMTTWFQTKASKAQIAAPMVDAEGEIAAARAGGGKESRSVLVPATPSAGSVLATTNGVGIPMVAELVEGKGRHQSSEADGNRPKRVALDTRGRNQHEADAAVDACGRKEEKDRQASEPAATFAATDSASTEPTTMAPPLK